MKCTNCAAPLAGADLDQPSCRFCGAMHPHIARAAEKVEIVKQMLAPGPNGLPVAMAAMMGQTGPAPPPGGPAVVSSSVVSVNGVPVHGGPGAVGVSVHGVPQHGGPVVMVNGVPVLGGGAPPMVGGPFGPVASPYAGQALALRRAQTSRSIVGALLVVVAVFVALAGAAFVVLLLT